MALPDESRPVAYILGTFPQASQTFIAREIRGLIDAGLPLLLFALRLRAPDVLEPPDRAWFPRVREVPRSLLPASIRATLWWMRRRPRRLWLALRTVVLLPHRPRILRLRAIALVAHATWIAREIIRAGGCRQIHAHFALAQTEVAMAVAALLDVPFSFTAHARDIYATPSALPEKLRAASVVVTCTAYNVAHLQSLSPDLPADHVRLVYHGVSLPLPRETPGTLALHTPPLLLAAGRLIEKKGFDDLIAACAELRDRGVRFTCQIVGTGPLARALKSDIEARSLTAIVELPGWMPAEALSSAMARAAAIVVPSRISPRGDRDGIPNVVLEAMAVGRPVVATRVSGIPEAVQHDVTGLLVEPGDRAALAAALERVLTNPAGAMRMGDAGRQAAHERFDLGRSSTRLIEIFSGPRGNPTFVSDISPHPT